MHKSTEKLAITCLSVLLPAWLRGRSAWARPLRALRQDRGVIERYTRPEMGRLWSEAHKYELWCQVEVLVLEAHARAGTVLSLIHI